MRPFAYERAADVASAVARVAGRPGAAFLAGGTNLVDLIKPMRTPPWQAEPEMIGKDPNDLLAAEIEGLAWHESAPSFEAVAIDEKGEPLRIIATDPRVWAAHKLWLSNRKDREPLKRRRDEAQARIVARLVGQYMPHLPFVSEELRMLPKDVVENAAPLFK